MSSRSVRSCCARHRRSVSTASSGKLACCTTSASSAAAPPSSAFGTEIPHPNVSKPALAPTLPPSRSAASAICAAVRVAVPLTLAAP
jgi:hypothetical protein